jgi:beta-glucosidase
MKINFPADFLWGAGSSAYQAEGAWNADGKGPSIWDVFSHTEGKVRDGVTGDVACDSYNRYKEDIGLMKELGINAYRFSISWPRILPNGSGDVNRMGLEYYHRFVDELLASGIEPVCVLYHWDLPDALQRQGGWKNRDLIIPAILEYAKIIFEEFGTKIKYWMTINEPWVISFMSHYIGFHPPGENDLQAAIDVSHHMMVAHGEIVRLFRHTGNAGWIGFCPNLVWGEPYSSRQDDVDANRRYKAWFNEWFLDPIFKGSYPSFMVEQFEKKGGRLNIRPGDMAITSQPIDFLGINYYTGNIVRYSRGQAALEYKVIHAGFEMTDCEWFIDPQGMLDLLFWIQKEYGDIPLYITENGAGNYEEPGSDGIVIDDRRINYLKRHLLYLHRALESNLNVKGYFVWSFMDNFEWTEGYTLKFGIVHVDFTTQQRTKKKSFEWYREFIRRHEITF